MIRRWLKVALPTVIIAAGAVMIAAGSWIPLKAALARSLEAKALQRAAVTGMPEKPWSWADFRVAGQATIDGKRIFILDRATGQALAFGAGLHREVSRETNGIVLSGHRDTHFSSLEGLESGDTIEVSGLIGSGSYRVLKTQVIDIDQETIAAPPKNHLMLITCWPFGATNPETPKRFVVLAAPDPQKRRL